MGFISLLCSIIAIRRHEIGAFCQGMRNARPASEIYRLSCGTLLSVGAARGRANTDSAAAFLVVWAGRLFPVRLAYPGWRPPGLLFFYFGDGVTAADRAAYFLRWKALGEGIYGDV